MTKKEIEIEEFAQRKALQLKTKKPFIENIEFTYHLDKRNKFYSKIKAKIGKRIISIKQESYDVKLSIANLFKKLRVISNQVKTRRKRKLSYELLKEHVWHTQESPYSRSVKKN